MQNNTALRGQAGRRLVICHGEKPLPHHCVHTLPTGQSVNVVNTVINLQRLVSAIREGTWQPNFMQKKYIFCVVVNHFFVT